MGWEGSRLLFFETSKLAWSFLGALLARWKLGNREELECLLQESRNESYARLMLWELKGSLLLARWPGGSAQRGRNTHLHEKQSGMLMVIL